jgi:hypothetical protein
MKVLNKRDAGVQVMVYYIGRGSAWGNPFVIGKRWNRAEVIEKYREVCNRKARGKIGIG